jgi:hypothetical protein
LAGFIPARASAGPVDSTIRNDTNHFELIGDWFERPLWKMQPADAHSHSGKVLRYAVARLAADVGLQINQARISNRLTIRRLRPA